MKPTISQEIIKEQRRYYNKKTICHNYVYTDEQGETHFFNAKDPVSKLIEGSYASPSLAAGILYDKCALDIPFYRQDKDLMRNGIDISKQTLGGWAMTVAEQYPEPPTDRIKKDLSLLSHLMIDETVLQVIQNHKKGANKLGTIIATRSDRFEDRQMAYYLFSEKKDKAAFKSFLPLDYAGHISFNAASTHYQFSEATILGCNTHAKRMFLDAIKTRVDSQQFVKLSASEHEAWIDEKGNTALGLALRILMRYKKLYQIEHTARKQN